MQSKNLKIKNKKEKKAGFTLLETLVAIGILSAAIMGPLALVQHSLRSVSLAKNQMVAYYLAQEAVEYIRNRRDGNNLNNKNWFWQLDECITSACCIDVYASAPNDIYNMGNSSCDYVKYDNSTGRYGQNIGANTLFTRQVQIEEPVNDIEARITVTMSWKERFLGSAKTFVIQEHLFNWKK